MHQLADDSIKYGYALLAGLAALFGAAPLALNAWARLTGSLPDPEAWERHGGNHGPWWTSIQGLVIYLSDMALVVLLAATFASSIVIGLVKRRVTITLAGLALVALQVMIAYTHLSLLSWTID